MFNNHSVVWLYVVNQTKLWLTKKRKSLYQPVSQQFLLLHILTLMRQYGHFCPFGQIFNLNLAIILAMLVHMAQFFFSLSLEKVWN